MPLQVRLVHSLGDRLIDLPERSFESPLVIGRAPTADVQVPDALISRRHCVLYLHERQWYIQDGKRSARTFVNGQPALEPTPLQSGDVVTLGADPTPPTLEIDPFGLWDSGDVGEAGHSHRADDAEAYLPPTPAARNFPVPAPAASMANPGMPGAAPMIRPPSPEASGLPPQIGRRSSEVPPQIIASQTPEIAEDSAELPVEDWMATAPVNSAAQRYYVPKQSGWSTGMISGTIFTIIAIIGGSAYWYHVRQQAEIARRDADLAKVVEKTVTIEKDNSAAEQAEKERKEKALAALAAEANKPKVVSTEMAAAQDPGRQTAEWRVVEEAHSSFKPNEAIVVFNDYQKLYPETPYAGDLRRFTEDALDQLWWDHIAELVQERDEAKKEIVAKNRDLAQSIDPEFKKTLADEKAVLEEKLQHAQDALKELNYLSNEKPNLFDAVLMADLRRSRNPVMYNPWKESAEKKIKESRGKTAVW